MPSVLSTLATFDFRFRFYFTEGVERYTNLFGLQGHLLCEQQQLLLGTLGEGEAERDFELLQHKNKKSRKEGFRTYLKVHFADWAFCDEVVVVILDNLARACLSFLI